MIRPAPLPVAALLAIAGLQPAAPKSAQTASIYVSVRDAQGTLAKADFSVSLDGTAVEVIAATPGPHPVSAVFLLDWSSSMQSAFGPRIEQVSRGGQVLSPGFFDDIAKGVARIIEPDDRVRFASLGETIKVGPEIRRNDRSAVKAMREVYQPSGPSPIWDALDQSFTALEGSSARTGVIVVSDGRATGNDKGMMDVIAHAARSGSAVYPLALAQSTSMAILPGTGYRGLRQIAEASGGTFVDADAIRGGRGVDRAEMVREWMGASVERALEDLRGQYRLQVAIPSAAQMSKLTVTARHGRVRAPQYFSLPQPSLVPKLWPVSILR